MTAKESNTLYKLCAFAFLSIFTGFLTKLTGVFEEQSLINAYYILNQLSEITLILCVYGLTSHFTIRTVLEALIILCVFELFDELIGNNLSFRINDYALLIAALFIIIKRIRRHGRHKK